jgi:hypothetical protein
VILTCRASRLLLRRWYQPGTGFLIDIISHERRPGAVPASSFLCRRDVPRSEPPIAGEAEGISAPIS